MVRWPRGGDLAPFLDPEWPRATGRRHWLPGCWERDGRGQRSTDAGEGEEDLLRGGVGPGRTGSPQFPGAGRAQGVREPPNTPQVGAPPDPCPVPPQLCICTVAMMITGARPEDTGPPANTPTCTLTRVPMQTHTDARWPFTHTGGKTEGPACGGGETQWGRSCAQAPRSPGTHAGRGPAPTAGNCAQWATDRARPPPGPHPTCPRVLQHTQHPQLSSLPGQSPVWGMQGPH